MPRDKTCAARKHATSLLAAQAHHPDEGWVEFDRASRATPAKFFISGRFPTDHSQAAKRSGLAVSVLTARGQPRKRGGWLKRTQTGD
jgi:hypothetical protein